MATSIRSLTTAPALLRALVSNARLAVRLLREPRVPLFVKAVPVLALLYVISPLDFIPDVLPVIGELDDLGIVLLAVNLFLTLCPADSVAFHRSAITEGRRYSPMFSPGDYIDA